MNDEQLKQEINNHPEQLYRGYGKDPEIESILKKMAQQPLKEYYSNKYCLDIASRIPCGSVRELFDNAEKIREWLEG